MHCDAVQTVSYLIARSMVGMGLVSLFLDIDNAQLKESQCLFPGMVGMQC